MHRQNVFSINELFQAKWAPYAFTALADPDNFSIWKKFLKTAPAVLDEEHYHLLAVWLRKEFKLPVAKSMINKDPDYTLLVEAKPQPAKSSAEKQALAAELEIWNPRNLRIFFLEFLITSESVAPGQTKFISFFEKSSFEHRVNAILSSYHELLSTILKAYEFHKITAPEWKKSLNDELSDLKNLIKTSLKHFSTPAQFEYLQSCLSYVNDRRGLAFPASSELEKIANYGASNPPPSATSNFIPDALFFTDANKQLQQTTGEFDKTAATTSSASKSPSALVVPPRSNPQPFSFKMPSFRHHTTLSYILFGLMCGACAGILFALIAATIIYTSPALIVSAAVAAAIIATVTIAPIIGGLITGLILAARDQRIHRLTATSGQQERELLTNNAGIHRTVNPSGDSPSLSHHHHIHSSANVDSAYPTAVLPLASPVEKSQHMPAASTLSGSLR